MSSFLRIFVGGCRNIRFSVSACTHGLRIVPTYQPGQRNCETRTASNQTQIPKKRDASSTVCLVCQLLARHCNAVSPNSDRSPAQGVNYKSARPDREGGTQMEEPIPITRAVSGNVSLYFMTNPRKRCVAGLAGLWTCVASAVSRRQVVPRRSASRPRTHESPAVVIKVFAGLGTKRRYVY